MKSKPKLTAANGTNIEVFGEAILEFVKDGKDCGMRFLDSDVKKPLAAVSAMNDEGNTVVFSRKWGSYVENDETGERIKMDTFEMVLDATKQYEGKKKKVVTWARPEADKYKGMEVDNVDDEEVPNGWEKRSEGIYAKKTVFRGRCEE